MTELPPGQRERPDFPRFGLTPFAERFPASIDAPRLRISGDVEVPLAPRRRDGGPRAGDAGLGFPLRDDVDAALTAWSGVRFAEFFERIVVPQAQPAADATFVVLRAQDGARTSLPLEDLLADDVLLADRLDGAPLSVEHGAPLRLVAPAHYGYKSVKHLDRIEFWRSDANYRPFGLRFMVHPRARVALEERGQWVPGWLLRRLYRPLIASTVARFERAMAQRQGARAKP
ncbi:MAG: molybdopterin-dependent oxidoreductase [Deltaproteobacteria bacterium]|nr:molybdopterin-dependent oxidoreductase [Deltaproteobacteria bacterium]